MYKSPIFNGYSLTNHCLPPTSRGVTDVSTIQTLMGGAPIKIENTLNSPDFQTQVSGELNPQIAGQIIHVPDPNQLEEPEPGTITLTPVPHGNPNPSPTMRAPGNSCAICGDKATGKHYGAASCDGCKGFFRRSVRRKHTYTCRFSRTCEINKEARNTCRYCRLRKCFRAGMKREAVQTERDRISRRPVRPKQVPPEDDLSMDILRRAEKMANESFPEKNESHKAKQATRTDVSDSIKRQLLVLVEWAKCIPAFSSLTIDDQVSLLRARSAEHLILGCAQRSYLHNSYPSTVLLANNFVIQRDSPNNDADMAGIAARILDQICEPMKEINMDTTEVTALKAIMFFDYTASQLTRNNIKKVKRIRNQIICNLEDYILEHCQYTARGRLGEILCLIPTLQAISCELVDTIQFSKILGYAEVDALINEMLLNRDNGGKADILRQMDPINSNQLIQPNPFMKQPHDHDSSIANHRQEEVQYIQAPSIHHGQEDDKIDVSQDYYQTPIIMQTQVSQQMDLSPSTKTEKD